MFTRLIKERDSKGKIKSYDLVFNGQVLEKNTKYCPVCKQVKTKDLFSSRGNACKECANQRAKEWRTTKRKDPEYVQNFNAKIAEKNKQRKKEAVAFMGGKCQDCGGIFPPSVFDFHHVDMTTKEHNPSHILKNGLEKAKEELSKCILLCSNCHRIRHFEGGKNNVAKEDSSF